MRCFCCFVRSFVVCLDEHICPFKRQFEMCFLFVCYVFRSSFVISVDFIDLLLSNGIYYITSAQMAHTCHTHSIHFIVFLLIVSAMAVNVLCCWGGPPFFTHRPSVNEAIFPKRFFLWQTCIMWRVHHAIQTFFIRTNFHSFRIRIFLRYCSFRSNP